MLAWNRWHCILWKDNENYFMKRYLTITRMDAFKGSVYGVHLQVFIPFFCFLKVDSI